jgi:small multidrug resistance pump
MAWIWLLTAIALEVGATSSLHLTQEFRRLAPTAVVIALYAGAFYPLAQSVRYIDIGVAYAIWSAIGTGLIVAIGAIFHGNRISTGQACGLVLVTAGVIALNVGG